MQPTNSRSRKGRPSVTTPARQAAWLVAFAKTGTQLAACQATGVSRTTVHSWIKMYPDFVRAMSEAKLDIVDSLKNTALKRATEGGSDPLLIFLLKNLAPDEFSERIRHEFTTKTLDLTVNEILEAIRINVPECCPHCKTNLGIAPAIAQELMDMSDRLSNKKTEPAQ